MKSAPFILYDVAASINLIAIDGAFADNSTIGLSRRFFSVIIQSLTI
jgi:hypothetical protein